MSENNDNEELPIEVVLLDLVRDIKYIKNQVGKHKDSPNIVSILKSKADKLFNRSIVLSDTIQSLKERNEDIDSITISMDELKN